MANSDETAGAFAGRLRATVVARYSTLARTALSGGTPVDCAPVDFAAGGFGAAEYVGVADASDDALRASLGCGNPVSIADLRPGETVLDLGSGGGLDVLLSARRVGPTGVAYGLDASEDMLALARRNAFQAGVSNVEFLHGHIEEIPLPDGHVDVVISNCVINLSTDKPRALAEASRVLKPGGRLGISDVIAQGDHDPLRRSAAERRVGCDIGTLTGDEYRALLRVAGFTDIHITVTIHHGEGIASAIVRAGKPGAVG